MECFIVRAQICPRGEVFVATRAVAVHWAELIVQNEIATRGEVDDTVLAYVMRTRGAEVVCKSPRVPKAQIAA